MPLQIRRGTTTQRTAIVPLPGELIYDTTTGGIYVGNGTTSGGLAAVNLSPGDIRNVSATMFTTGVHTGISFVYEPSYNRINATINPDLSNYQGVIRASAFNGSVVADDSSLLVDALQGFINLNGTVVDDIIPKSFGPDLGSLAIPFNNVYVGGTVKIGSATISATSSRINLPAGSTVGGVVIGTGTGTGDGVIDGSNYRINIIGANSSVIVDSDNNTLKGSLKALDGTIAYNASTKAFTGTLTGNVTGNVTGNIISSNTAATILNTSGASATYTGAVTGNVTGNLTGNVTGNLISSNTSTTILNTAGATALFTGAVTGNVTGDIKGNILAADNSVVFSASTKAFTGTFNGNLTGDVSKTGFSILNITANNGGMDIKATNASGNPGDGDIRISNEGKGSLFVKGVTSAFAGDFNGAWIKLQASRGSLASPTSVAPSDFYGGLEASAYNGSKFGYGGYAGFIVDPDGTVVSGSNYVPSAFVINVSNGSSIDLNNVMAYGSNGVLTAPIIQPGVYATTTARDAFITAPSPGMMVYITATSKFMGYVNDAGGSNPGWVNLN